MSSTMVRLAGAAIVAGVLAACGGAGDPETEASVGSSTSVAATTLPATTVPPSTTTTTTSTSTVPVTTSIDPTAPSERDVEKLEQLRECADFANDLILDGGTVTFGVCERVGSADVVVAYGEFTTSCVNYVGPSCGEDYVKLLSRLLSARQEILLEYPDHADFTQRYLDSLDENIAIAQLAIEFGLDLSD